MAPSPLSSESASDGGPNAGWFITSLRRGRPAARWLGLNLIFRYFHFLYEERELSGREKRISMNKYKKSVFSTL